MANADERFSPEWSDCKMVRTLDKRIKLPGPGPFVI